MNNPTANWPPQSTRPLCLLAKTHLRHLPRTSRLPSKNHLEALADKHNRWSKRFYRAIMTLQMQDCLTKSSDAEICSCAQGKKSLLNILSRWCISQIYNVHYQLPTLQYISQILMTSFARLDKPRRWMPRLQGNARWSEGTEGEVHEGLSFSIYLMFEKEKWKPKPVLWNTNISASLCRGARRVPLVIAGSRRGWPPSSETSASSLVQVYIIAIGTYLSPTSPLTRSSLSS